MSLVLFGSSQSTSFQCGFSISSFYWGTLGKVYVCFVQDGVNITTPDAAQVDSISGEHQAGYNNDNVVAISVYNKALVHYFPRGLTNFFKNLKGIEIQSTGLKEVHQSDLKDYPNLNNLWLWNSNLEIIEENLFEFNPNLEAIYLSSNNISHIDSNVFDKLTKLKSLYLASNTCINMVASNNPTEVQNVIKTAQTQCTNSDYSNLEQKAKNLQTESKNLNSENFKIEIENLENEIKNSKFPNFFQENLKDLKAGLVEKKKMEFLDAISKIVKNNSIEVCSALEYKVNFVADNLQDLMTLTSNQINQSKAEFAVLTDKFVVQDLKISGIEEKMTKISDAIEQINKNYEDLNRKFTNLMNALKNAFSAGHQGT